MEYIPCLIYILANSNEENIRVRICCMSARVYEPRFNHFFLSCSNIIKSFYAAKAAAKEQLSCNKEGTLLQVSLPPPFFPPPCYTLLQQQYQLDDWIGC